MKTRFVLFLLSAILVLTCNHEIHLPPNNCTRRVSLDARQGGDGLTWATAFLKIDKAIESAARTIAEDNDVNFCEIWVAEGTYDVYQTSRSDTLRLRENVHLYGGFEGDEVDRAQRDFKKNKTVLSGRSTNQAGDQVYHVVTGDNNAILDGFEIAYGYARRERYGGGMYNDGVSPTLRNCLFRQNRSDWFGGAIFNNLNKPTIKRCKFENNKARYGGAIANQSTNAKIFDSIFVRNEASNKGGVLHMKSEDHTRIANSIFYDNKVKGNGAVIYSYYYCKTKFSNCTFVNNSSSKIKSLFYNQKYSDVNIENSIIWDNDEKALSKKVAIKYSIVQEKHTGKGNREINPLLIKRKNGFITLKPGSPAIDAAFGKTATPTDLNGNPRVDVPNVVNYTQCKDNDKVCISYADLGALEYGVY